MQRLGIDIGSKTLKLVLLDDDGTVLFTSYQKHRSRIYQCLRDAIHALVWRRGDRTVSMTVTGSSGMRVAEVFGIPFVQEVVALKLAVLQDYPAADAILEMGGEDTKLIYLTGAPEQRMNNICAGGTGSFIETMGGLMGVRTAAFSRLALGYTTIYPIASRCAVFAKSDVRPLLNAGARKEDIAASVLDAVCTQAVAGLSAGRPITGTVLLLGGPFQHIQALRDSFCRVTGMSRSQAVVPRDAHLFVARGAALSKRCSEAMSLAEFENKLINANFENDEGIGRLRPLFSSEEELAAFRERHRSKRVPRCSLINAGTDLFLGVDAGSTTAKLALIDANGALISYDYQRHRGDAVGCLTEMLKKLFVQLYAPYTEEHVVRRSCVVGYGEEICKVAFGIDMGEVETVAHLRAATAIDPDVDFLMDIGGQDIKCFYVQDGVIQDVVLNEACSSGCGSLFDSVVRGMNRNRSDAVGDALRATAPVDLGTRCTTFMNSRIRHAQKEGAPHADIIAGVCYATVRNALFKVVRQPDFSKVGKHIVVQGGAFANDALLRAFELETGVEVSRPDLAPIMGAWGAALLARDAWLAQKRDDPQAAEQARSQLISPSSLSALTIRKKVVRCDICTNRCELRITSFGESEDKSTRRTYGTNIVAGSERALVTGNRCERGALAHGGKSEIRFAPPNIVKMKRALIASYGDSEAVVGGNAHRMPFAQSGEPIVGIPKALELYETYPFWRTFLSELGVSVVDGADPSDDVFRMGMASIPSEGMCYPAKLAYGHAVDLAKRGAEALFMPMVESAFARFGLAGLPFNGSLSTCPLVENMAEMVAGNAAGSPIEALRIAAPDLRSAKSLSDLPESLSLALADIGVIRTVEDVEAAVAAASREYRAFKDKLAGHAEEVLRSIDEGSYPGIVLIGHPYHAAWGISHGIDELLGDLGYAVLERTDYNGFGPEACEDAMNDASDKEAGREHAPSWYENADAMRRIRQCEEHPDMQAIIVRSFGCGIDALAADRIRDALKANGSIYTELKIDQIIDLATVRIRLRSLAYAHKQRQGISDVFPLTVEPEAYEAGFVSPLSAQGSSASSMRQRDASKTGRIEPKRPTGKQTPKKLVGRDIRLTLISPTGEPVDIDVHPLDGVPAPGTRAKGLGPEKTFEHEYQGLAFVQDVPVPNDVPAPGE